tara:strand:+ start:1235 stop:1768 length:534 start_codon:yes stop_codon:yes gene_type:complete
MNFQKISILILSVVIIGLGIEYYSLKETNKNLMESKNFNFDWSPGQEVLFSYRKSNNKLSDQYIDRNFDNNYEVFNTYDIFGNLHQTGYDSNENGVYEKFLIFDPFGEKVGNNMDSNEDGVIDEFSLTLDSKNELKFVDSDHDGRFEKIIFFNMKNSNTTEMLTENFFKNNTMLKAE